MKFQGKISIWFWTLAIAINIVFVFSLIDMLSDDIDVAGLVAMFIALFISDIIIVPILIRNYVLIKDNELIIVFGISKDSFVISDIYAMYETHNPLASTAASLDRIVLKSHSHETMISVKDKKKFFIEMYRKNPRLMEER